MTIDWNEGISTEENDRRTQELLDAAKGRLETTTAMMGTQEFILSHTKDITNNEAVVYLKAHSKEALDSVQSTFMAYLQKYYPDAKMEMNISGNVYDLIFQTDKPDLEIRLQKEDGGMPSVGQAKGFVDSVRNRFPDAGIQPVATENVLRYVANPEQMALYHVSYSQLYSRLKELAGSDKVFDIASGDQSIPVMIGSGKAHALDERIGYYGEHIVLLAQTLGLNTCWVGLSYSKVPGTYVLDEGEKIACYIAIGYGETQGSGHKIKTVEQVSNASDITPSWFKKGVEAALLAPTAVNQQKFSFEYVGMSNNRHQVRAKKGFSMIGYTQMDLGIAKYHFEVGAGKVNFEWV